MRPSNRRRVRRRLAIVAIGLLALTGAGCSIDQETVYNVLYALLESYGAALSE